MIKRPKMTYKLNKEEEKGLEGGLLRIRDGLEKIEENAFVLNSKIIKLVVPASVKSIEEKAFYGCENLRFIVFEGRIPPISPTAFKACEIYEIEYFSPFESEEDRKGYDKMVSDFFDVKGRTVIHYNDEKEATEKEEEKA